MADEEVIMEVQAVRAVYGDDCTVLNTYPPHLHVHIKPRTANVSSQQFVEAAIEIRANPQYPSDPPDINVIWSKGLDEERLKHLSASLHDKACELTSCLMLVALCEEAVERLSVMNHPHGNCPLCLYPLVTQVEQNESLPFMKLMSCFHCFHSECIIRWWKWLQLQNDSNGENSTGTVQSSASKTNQHDIMGNCPVCRKVFHDKDIEHAIKLAGSCSMQKDLAEEEACESASLLQWDLETSRQQKFETILQLQKESGGLIEARKDGVLFSGIVLPELVTDSRTIEQQGKDQAAVEDPESSGSSNRAHKTKQHQRFRQGPTEREPHGSSGGPPPSQRRNAGTGKYYRKTSRPRTQQWIKKEKP
ncbi:hypothetical protein Nepgr_002482 [Nepenthes gracilis]|uniref:E3 ubiquitin-protein ligase RNF25 n=1 Tax=Nepenthes gracilis TaxID=150966 RepID=A0AAD3P718_NEPGR|nr:hypothetical protein Nepgr_002482 [Nepenthes gracilis]